MCYIKNILIIFFFVLILIHAKAQKATDTFKLYFDINIPELSSNAEKKINLLIYNDKIINGSTIMIIGYADYLGRELHNKKLSMERAENVKNTLVKYGINPADIKLCLGKGQITRKGLIDKQGFPTDRRVDIVVDNIIKNEKLPVKTKKDTPIVITRIDKTPVNAVVVTDLNEISKFSVGTTILLKNVYFPPDRHVIKAESYETLEKLFQVLKQNPKLKISIEGHVCCIIDAPDAFDIDTGEPILSVNRAKAIYDFLIKKGIEDDRLFYTGFGKRKPIIANEKTEQDAEKNRRVEIRILENG